MAARLVGTGLKPVISVLGRAHEGDSFWSAILTSSVGHLVRGVSVFPAPARPAYFNSLALSLKVLVNRTPDEFCHRGACPVGKNQ